MKRHGLHRMMLAGTAMCLLLCLTGCSTVIRELFLVRECVPNDTAQAVGPQASPGTRFSETRAKLAAADATPEANSQEAARASYQALCSRLQENGRLAGVALLGYVNGPTEAEYANLLQRRGYLDDYAFLAGMGEDHLIRAEEGHQLYCVVPADTDVSVTVSAWMGSPIFGDETGQAGDVLYSSDSGEPLLLLCGHDMVQPNLQVRLERSDGTFCFWYPIPGKDDRIPYLGGAQSALMDFTPNTGVSVEDYDFQIAAPEILQGDWVAWDQYTGSGEPQVCRLRFYRDAAGNDRVEYCYGPPVGEVYARLDGDFVHSVTPAGWITEEMSAFYMDLIGGTAMETGLPADSAYDEPYSFVGIYDIRYYPQLDVIEIGHMFNRPLLNGRSGHWMVFERSTG